MTIEHKLNPPQGIETTMIGGAHTFTQARSSGNSMAETFKSLAQETGNEAKFRQWSLPVLRTQYRITPME